MKRVNDKQNYGGWSEDHLFAKFAVAFTSALSSGLLIWTYGRPEVLQRTTGILALTYGCLGLCCSVWFWVRLGLYLKPATASTQRRGALATWGKWMADVTATSLLYLGVIYLLIRAATVTESPISSVKTTLSSGLTFRMELQESVTFCSVLVTLIFLSINVGIDLVRTRKALVKDGEVRHLSAALSSRPTTSSSGKLLATTNPPGSTSLVCSDGNNNAERAPRSRQTQTIQSSTIRAGKTDEEGECDESYKKFSPISVPPFPAALLNNPYVVTSSTTLPRSQPPLPPSLDHLDEAGAVTPSRRKASVRFRPEATLPPGAVFKRMPEVSSHELTAIKKQLRPVQKPMATPKKSQPESLNEAYQEPKSRKSSVSVEPSSLGPANSNMPPPSPAVLAALGELYEEQQASSRKVPKTCSSTEAPSTAEKAPPSIRDCKLRLESNSCQIDSEPQDDTKDDMSRSSSQNPQGPESLRVNQVPPRLGENDGRRNSILNQQFVTFQSPASNASTHSERFI